MKLLSTSCLILLFLASNSTAKQKVLRHNKKKNQKPQKVLVQVNAQSQQSQGIGSMLTKATGVELPKLPSVGGIVDKVGAKLKGAAGAVAGAVTGEGDKAVDKSEKSYPHPLQPVVNPTTGGLTFVPVFFQPNPFPQFNSMLAQTQPANSNPQAVQQEQGSQQDNDNTQNFLQLDNNEPEKEKEEVKKEEKPKQKPKQKTKAKQKPQQNPKQKPKPKEEPKDDGENPDHSSKEEKEDDSKYTVEQQKVKYYDIQERLLTKIEIPSEDWKCKSVCNEEYKGDQLEEQRQLCQCVCLQKPVNKCGDD